MSDSQGKEYEVEDIVDDRERKDHYDRRARKWIYVKEYLIKWVGYKKHSWEPEENLDNCSKLLNEYKRRKNKSNASAKNNKIYFNTERHKSRTPLKLGSNRRRNNDNNNNNNNYNNNNKITKAKEEPKEDAKEEAREEAKDEKEEIKEPENDFEIKLFKNYIFSNGNNNTNGLVEPNFSGGEGEEKDFPMNNDYNSNSYFYPTVLKSENEFMNYGDSAFKNNDQLRTKLFNNINELFSQNIIENELQLDKFLCSYNNSFNNNDSNYDNIDLIKPFGERMLEIEKEEEKSDLRNNLLQKKRKINSLDNEDESSISISIDDPFIKNEKESISILNTNDNSNSNSVSNNNVLSVNKINQKSNDDDNIEIVEVFIPEKDEEVLNLLCINKENGTPYYASINDSSVPEKVKINCFERIMRKFLKGKTIKINQLSNS